MENSNASAKNWLWAATQVCPQCGMDPSSIPTGDLSARLRTAAGAWRALLGRGDIVAQRPPAAEDTEVMWSALEYGAHVRDASRVLLDRLTLMLKKDNPTFPDWDQDQAALDGSYQDDDPAKVAFHLASNVGKAADIVDRIRADRWARTGTRSDGAEFTVETCVYYLLHEIIHHLHDAETGIEAMTGDEV